MINESCPKGNLSGDIPHSITISDPWENTWGGDNSTDTTDWGDAPNVCVEDPWAEAPDNSQSKSPQEHESLTLLRRLGYQVGDRVEIRGLAPKKSPTVPYINKKGVPREVALNEKGEKLFTQSGHITLTEGGYSLTLLEYGKEERKYLNGIEKLREINDKGYGIYFYPNPGGTRKKSITECRAVFFECDDAGKDEQWERIKRLPISPSIVVETRNSLHTYYVLSEDSRQLDGWVDTQLRLIQLMESDKSLIKENQMMRLPGYNHRKYGVEPVPVHIASFTGEIYQREFLEGFLPELPKKEKATKERQAPNYTAGKAWEGSADDSLLGKIAADSLKCESLARLALEAIDPANRRGANDTNLYEFVGIIQAARDCGIDFLTIERWGLQAPAKSADDRISRVYHGLRGEKNFSRLESLIYLVGKAKRFGFKIPKEFYPAPNLGEPDAEAYRAYQAQEKEQERIDDEIENERSIADFVRKAKRCIKRFKPLGFGKKETPTPDRSHTDNIAKVWAEVLATGAAVLDTSMMGSGKTHAVPQLGNETGKIFYVHSDHRNPTINAIAETFTDLPPRSKYGFYQDEDGKLKVASYDTPKDLIVQRGNCERADLFHGLTNLGYDPNNKDGEKLNPICRTCPAANFCPATPGMYRHDRREALKAKYIRCDLSQLTPDIVTSEDILIVDEAMQSIKPFKKIETTFSDLLTELYNVRQKLDDNQFLKIDHLMQEIKALCEDSPQYGHKPPDIRNKITLDAESLSSLIEVLESNPLDLAEIFTESDDIDWKQAKREGISYDSVKTARSGLRGENFKETLKKLEGLPPNGLLNVLKFLRGDAGIALRIDKQRIKLEICDRYYSEILNSAKGVILLDATATVAGIQQVTGLTRPIMNVQKAINKPLKNLTVHCYETQGLGSNSIEKPAIERVQAGLSVLTSRYGSMGVICPKSIKEKLGGATGHWFRDNRGSNAYEGQEHLAFVGSPYPNIGDVEDEFYALTGSLDGFKDYYADRVRNEIFQGEAGRQRCHRYLNKHFHVHFFATGLDLSWMKEYGCTVINHHAFELSPDAGDTFQFTLWGIVDCIRTTGANTGRAIAEKLEKSAGAVNKFLRENGIKLCDLIKHFAPDTQPIENTIGRVSTHEELNTDEFYRQLFRLKPLELAAEVIADVVAAGGWEAYKTEILPLFPPPLREKIVATLIWLMGAENDLFATDTGG